MGSPYQSQSAVNYNSSPPPDDGSTVAANKITWAKIKSALADSIKTLADAMNTALRTALNVTPSTTSIAYTTLVGDHLTTIEATGTFTVSLGDAATMIAQTMGYTTTVYNKGTGTVTVGVVTAANTLAGQANGTVSLPPGAAMTFTVAQSGVGYDIVSATGFAPFVLTGAAGTNTITANAPANLIALYSGLRVLLIPANTTTGAATVNITPSGGSALTAKNIFSDGAAAASGDLKVNVPVELVYDGTQFNIPDRPLRVKLINSTFDMTSATNTNKAITGVGFKPRLVRMAVAFGTTSSAASVGDSDGTTEWCNYSNDGASAGKTINSAILGIAVESGADNQQFSISTGGSLDSDGCTVKNTKTGAPTGTINMSFTFFR